MSIASWREMVAELVDDPEMQDLSDPQVKAIVEVLALTIHADCKVSPVEVAGFNHLFFDLPWLANRHQLVRNHVPEAAERAAVAGDETQGRVVAEAAAKTLRTDALRKQVFQMAASLASVDMNVNAADNIALKWIGDAFGLEVELQSMLVQRARG